MDEERRRSHSQPTQRCDVGLHLFNNEPCRRESQLNPGTEVLSASPTTTTPDMFQDWRSAEEQHKFSSQARLLAWSPLSDEYTDARRSYSYDTRSRSQDLPVRSSSAVPNVLDERGRMGTDATPSPPPIARLNVGEPRILTSGKGASLLVSPIPLPSQGQVPAPIGPWAATSTSSMLQISRSTPLEDAFFIPVSAFAPARLTSPPPHISPSLHYFYEIKSLPVLTDKLRSEFFAERCPLCLKSDNFKKSLVEMRCRRLGCRHIAHSDCLAGSNLQQILRTHTNIFVRVRLLEEAPELTNDALTDRGFQVEMAVLHTISNIQHSDFHSNAPVFSSQCLETGFERVFLRAQDQATAPLMTLDLPKGRLCCQCTSNDSRQQWQFSGNYNMMTYPSGPREFVLVDASSDSTLTLTLDNIITQSDTAWGVQSARFDLLPLPSQQSPTPLLFSLRSDDVSVGPIRRSFFGGEVGRASSSLEFRVAPDDGDVRTPPSSTTASSFTSMEGLTMCVSGVEASAHLLSRIVGRVSDLAKSQSGSRFLQDRIREGDEQYISVIFAEVHQDLPSLMVDLFGNYLCQRLICKCSDEQRKKLLMRLSNHIVDVSCNRQGTRVMQKIIQFATTSEQRKILIDALSKDVILLMRDPHGSYVVNSMLEHFPMASLAFTIDAACAQCDSLAVNQHGLCVLKKCLSMVDDNNLQLLTKQIMSKQIISIVNNEYGNYLIQHLLTVNKKQAGLLLHERLRGHYCVLSRQKFSSNVVEKTLAVVNAKVRNEIIAEFTENPESIALLLQDSYGNYVMQNTLSLSSGEQAQLLINLIRPLLKTLRKNIQKKWERLLKSTTSRIQGGANRSGCAGVPSKAGRRLLTAKQRSRRS